MDDLQFRRSIYADPQTSDDAIIDAMKADPAKLKFAQDIDKLDHKIAQALNIPVPDDLCNKLILRQTMVTHQQQKRKGHIRLAIAASVTFAMGLTFNFMQFSSAYTSLGDHAIAHVEHEAGHFSNDAEAKVSLTSLNKKMASFNGSFAESFGELMVAGYCRFDGIKSLHLVFQGKKSPVTVFIIPNDDQLSFSANFSNEALNGKSLRFNETNIIVIADKEESIQQWENAINENIRWSA